MSFPLASLNLARSAAQTAADKLGADIVAFDVSDHLALADIFLLVSAESERQANAIADGVVEALKVLGHRPKHVESSAEQRWILIDFGDLVVHVQHEEERAVYALDRLWSECPVLDMPVNMSAAAGR